MTQKNWPLLIKVARQIIAHPETWDQTHYVNTCGTAFCFAGHAALFSGCAPHIDRQMSKLSARTPVTIYDDAYVSVPDGLFDALDEHGWFAGRMSGIASAELVGVAVLGLNTDAFEHSHLFAPDNGLDEILLTLNEWAVADDVELPEDLKVSL